MSAFERLGIDSSKISSNTTYSANQTQTEKAFAFKWRQRETYESEAMKSNARNWLIERYLDNQPQKLNEFLAGGRKIILDAGCGSGFSGLLFFGDKLADHDYLGVDISDAVSLAKKRFAELGYPGDFLKYDLLQLPIPDESIDIIFSEGVLHHTNSTEAAIKRLATKLKQGGKFLFYVYRKKAVIREFTDDYIRQQLTLMSDEEAWKALESLTQLGIALGELNVEINVPADIPFLGIQKGQINLQRFVYWNICKLFYKPEFSLDEMNHINFDWFRPLNCHRHTPEEIKLWCQQASLDIEHMNVQEAGITVVATKCFPAEKME